jgi:choline dehydrogenase
LQGLEIRRNDAGWECTGVRVARGTANHDAAKESTVVSAHSSVTLCAGSVGSAQLLQVSGIGPLSVLQAAHVPVSLDRPGVGANLQDHLQIRRVFSVSNVKTLNTQANSLLGKATMAAEYLLRRTGPLSMAPSQLGAFACSSASRPYDHE